MFLLGVATFTLAGEDPPDRHVGYWLLIYFAGFLWTGFVGLLAVKGMETGVVASEDGLVIVRLLRTSRLPWSEVDDISVERTDVENPDSPVAYLFCCSLQPATESSSGFRSGRYRSARRKTVVDRLNTMLRSRTRSATCTPNCSLGTRDVSVAAGEVAGQERPERALCADLILALRFDCWPCTPPDCRSAGAGDYSWRVWTLSSVSADRVTLRDAGHVVAFATEPSYARRSSVLDSRRSPWVSISTCITRT